MLIRLENGDVMDTEEGGFKMRIQLDGYLDFMNDLFLKKVRDGFRTEDIPLFISLHSSEICRMLRDHCDYKFKEYEI